MKDLSFEELIEAYNKSNIKDSVSERAKEFEKLTGRSKRTYYRVKYFVINGEKKEYKHRSIADTLGTCYFCTNKSKVIHHIDTNSNNNVIENLLPLCYRCHANIHLLYKKMNYPKKD